MLAAQPVVVQAAQPADGHPRAFTNTPKSQKGGRRIGGEYPDSGSTMDDKDRNRSLYWDHSHASTRNNAATAFEHFHKFLQHEYINAKKKLYIVVDSTGKLPVTGGVAAAPRNKDDVLLAQVSGLKFPGDTKTSGVVLDPMLMEILI